MAGVGVGEISPGGINHGAPESDEAIGRDIAADNGIEALHELAGGFGIGGDGAKAGLKIGHEQGSADAFADDVADADGEAAFAEFEDVEVIATDEAGGVPGAGNIEAAYLRDALGEQALLDFAGFA